MSDTAQAPTGSSILTAGIPQNAPAAAQNGGNPSAGQQQIDGITDAMRAAERPEWAPEKYWDPEKKSVRTEDLAKGYINLEKLLGHEKVPKPISDEDQEGWDRWYAASGRPDSHDAYEFARPDKLPDGLPYDEDLEKDFRATAHGMGLNKKQAAGLYEKFVKNQIERYGAYETHKQQARVEAENDMRREFGAKYDAKLQQAKVALSNYADPEFRKYLDESGLGNDPRMVRAFVRIGEQMQGDTRVHGKVEPTVNTADLQRTIQEFNSKHQKALYDRDHPEHQLRVKERGKLYEAAFGDQ